MNKYRKRPIVILAWQAKPSGSDFPQHVKDNMRPPGSGYGPNWQIYDKLHDTWVNFDWYDWIIEGVQGELYPCKPDVFEQTYVAVYDEPGESREQEQSMLSEHLKGEVLSAHVALDKIGAPKTVNVRKRVGEGDQEITLTLAGRIMRLRTS